MKRIEAIIEFFRLDGVKEALLRLRQRRSRRARGDDAPAGQVMVTQPEH